jgi:hypothetical protein
MAKPYFIKHQLFQPLVQATLFLGCLVVLMGRREQPEQRGSSGESGTSERVVHLVVAERLEQVAVAVVVERLEQAQQVKYQEVELVVIYQNLQGTTNLGNSNLINALE